LIERKGHLLAHNKDKYFSGGSWFQSTGPSCVSIARNLGVVDPSEEVFDFSRQIFEKFPCLSCNFTKEIDFSRQVFNFSGNFPKFSIFLGKFPKDFDFFSRFKKTPIFQTKFAHFPLAYFWPGYSISLQKSPLSNILLVHDKIY